MNVEFTVLGTGSANPQPDRFPSAYLLTVESDYILLDCGEGTQYRLLEQRIKFSRLRHIFITHLHGDHYFGLVGLLSSLNLNRRTEPMTLIGPPGLAEIVTLQLKYSRTSLFFDIHFIETNPAISQEIYQHPCFTVTTVPLVHRVPCTGYVIETPEGDRKMLKSKLPENFPVPHILKLKKGEDVADELTGRLYKAAEMTKPGLPGKKIAYCTDTAYSEAILPVIAGADLLYHEATFTNADEARATFTNHSTARQAALIAQKSNAKKLIIGHYSSRYKEVETHLLEAKAVFGNTLLANEGLRVKV